MISRGAANAPRRIKGGMMTDEHGQPPAWLNYRRRLDRGVDELIGLCKGMAADGRIVQAEADFLLRWLCANSELANQYPVDILYARVKAMLRDGVLDAQEQKELFSLLRELCGNDAACQIDEVNLSASLPLNKPMPDVVFEGRIFLFTGKFAFGDRKSCQFLIQSLGGKTAAGVVQGLDYLVIGNLGSRDWIHTTHGRKIEAAVEYRDKKGLPLAIINEPHWLDHVERLTLDG